MSGVRGAEPASLSVKAIDDGGAGKHGVRPQSVPP